ncbi:uracil-DNA glycosylase [methane-oxidizing endosymbiont of Gigantopelta aegis]|uniref:uracil-DNA glycosylase n=1 Tax=methane-oxidizing endosymbiont of Gigantopelta aegis TaxID=2794938 RepID=UPI0018DD14C5|nr:uracil-DNA glycosylase [methane-oxidizing endosymbiont of Gigantopelta aegis]
MSDTADDNKRLQYLQAMGVNVWQLRQAVDIDSDDHALMTQYDGAVVGDLDAQWERLRQTVAECQRCELHQTRTQTVFGVGDRNADWMLIGEAPGQQEDAQGEPFVGPAGQLLTEMIRALGYSREQVYITNILKCRPPNNRDPHSEEISACSDFLEQQISWVKPKIILAVGRVAAQNLLHSKQPLAKLRGVVHKWDDIPVIVIYHPAYLLRSLLEKRKAWQDLKFARHVYQGLQEGYAQDMGKS